jgi:hypothetical protein
MSCSYRIAWLAPAYHHFAIGGVPIVISNADDCRGCVSVLNSRKAHDLQHQALEQQRYLSICPTRNPDERLVICVTYS